MGGWGRTRGDDKKKQGRGKKTEESDEKEGRAGFKREARIKGRIWGLEQWQDETAGKDSSAAG